MSFHPGSPVRAVVITVSDSCFKGTRKDVSGALLVDLLAGIGITEIASEIVPDDKEVIAAALRRGAERAEVVVTTGGTGLAPRDVTPEATREVCERIVEGLAERMRAEGARQTPMAALSRGVCGTIGRTLILNLPGSPAGAESSFSAVLPLIPHAVTLLAGHTAHDGSPEEWNAGETVE